MYFVSSKVSDKIYGITDTADFSEEACSLQDIRKYVNLGIEIAGVEVVNSRIKSISVCDDLKARLHAKIKLTAPERLGGNDFIVKEIDGETVLVGISDALRETLVTSAQSPFSYTLIIPDGINRISKLAFKDVEWSKRYASRGLYTHTCEIEGVRIKSIVFPPSLREIGGVFENWCIRSLELRSGIEFVDCMFMDCSIGTLHIAYEDVWVSHRLFSNCKIKSLILHCDKEGYEPDNTYCAYFDRCTIGTIDARCLSIYNGGMTSYTKGSCILVGSKLSALVGSFNIISPSKYGACDDIVGEGAFVPIVLEEQANSQVSEWRARGDYVTVTLRCNSGLFGGEIRQGCQDYLMNRFYSNLSELRSGISFIHENNARVVKDVMYEKREKLRQEHAEAAKRLREEKRLAKRKK